MSKTVACILHSPADTAGTFKDFFIQNGYAFEIIVAPRAQPKEFATAGVADILLVMGGAMGVYENKEFPFLRTEIELLKNRIATNSPTLGICLGAQLLAAAAGAKVYLSKKEEFGWFPLMSAESGRRDPVVGKTLWQKPVFHWHQDAFDLPSSAENLLFSERCASQAFKLSDKIYGFQFHLELNAKELPEWIEGEPDLAYGKSPGTQSKDLIISGGNLYGDELKKAAYAVLSNFIEQI